ncbi:MAG: hypothetical protein VSS75_010580 [Candidatus Parabeggiatoa sp.]|nr:hypothetical protein [Candidatus Parabeggiatoa sp.]
MRTLTLHIGTHKTGSTSLQGFLFRNKERLRAQGYYFPTEGSYYWPQHNGHSGLAHALAGTRPSWLGAEIKILSPEASLAELHGHIRSENADHVLISSEHLFLRLEPKVLKAAFEHLGYQLKVLVFLRRQDEFLESRYAQLVKTGRICQGISAFVDTELNDTTSYSHYYHRLAALAKVFGHKNIVLKSVKADQPQTQLYQDFLEAVELSFDPNYSLPPVRNPSPPAELILIMETLQRHSAGDESRHRTLNKQLLASAGFSDQKTTLLSSEWAQRILDQFAEENRRIAREFLGQESLFDSLDPTLSNPCAAPSQQALAEIGIPLWGALHRENSELHDKIKTLKAKIQHYQESMNHDQ